MRTPLCIPALIGLAATLGVAVGTPLTAQRPSPAPRSAVTRAATARAAFDPARLTRLDSALQQSVDSAWIAGAVALVLRDGEVVYERSVGCSDREANRPMSTDAIFRIASQSKALTSVATLMLVEEGRVALGDPVSRWIPSFAHTSVASRADSGRTLTPARRAITIFDLLTHTAGVSYGTESFVSERYAAAALGPVAGFGWYTANKDEPICETMDRLGALPFVAQPGEAWVYGYNTDILGCVVERASGLSLDEFFRTRITGPLGMRYTQFFLPLAQRDRLAAVYRSDATGHIVRADTGARPGALLSTGREGVSPVEPDCSPPRTTTPPSCSCCSRGAPSTGDGSSHRAVWSSCGPTRWGRSTAMASASDSALRPPTVLGRTATTPWAHSLGAVPTPPCTRWIPRSGSYSC